MHLTVQKYERAEIETKNKKIPIIIKLQELANRDQTISLYKK